MNMIETPIAIWEFIKTGGLPASFGVIAYYFYTENKQLKKDISKVIEEHKDDLLKRAEKAEEVADKYHNFVNELKMLVGYKKNETF